jgi:hypothetical protein
MVEALKWIANHSESRDFAAYKPHVQRLPESLTSPNMGEVVMEDEYAVDEFSLMSSLF